MSVSSRIMMSESATQYIYYCRNLFGAKELPAALTRLERDGAIVEAVPCGGKIDPRYVLKALESGAAAVCVIVCPAVSCRSLEGSARAGRRIDLVRELVTEAGLDPNAVALFRPKSLDSTDVDAATEQAAEFAESFVRFRQGVTQ